MSDINYDELQSIVATSKDYKGTVMEYSVSRGTVTFIDDRTGGIVTATIDSVRLEIEEEVAE